MFYFQKQNNDIQSYTQENAERLLKKQNCQKVLRTKI